MVTIIAPKKVLVSDLTVDARLQRETDFNRAKKYADAFDPAQFDEAVL